jgi:predicted Zn-dependent peptidase
MIGLYVGTREENLAQCVEIAIEQVADIAAGNLRAGELERAKESLKGRIMLSMESTSNRMSRLGKSIITETELMTFDRIFAEIDAVQPDDLADLAGVLLAPEGLSASGVGPDEDRFRAAVERANPALLSLAAA